MPYLRRLHLSRQRHRHEMPDMPPAPQPTDRQIRVFISSTFRDMMCERDLLVKEVFPELRRKCAKRFVIVTEVDLRWGILAGYGPLFAASGALTNGLAQRISAQEDRNKFMKAEIARIKTSTSSSHIVLPP